MLKKIYVYAGWLNDDFIGTIHILRSSGKEVISFEYSEDWLKDHSNIFSVCCQMFVRIDGGVI